MFVKLAAFMSLPHHVVAFDAGPGLRAVLQDARPEAAPAVAARAEQREARYGDRRFLVHGPALRVLARLAREALDDVDPLNGRAMLHRVDAEDLALLAAGAP